MGNYEVLQPVSFVRDGAAVHHTIRQVGNVVEVDDAEAAPLVEAGKLAPQKVEQADAVAVTRSFDDGYVGEPPSEAEESTESEPERPSRRRTRSPSVEDE